MPSTLQPADTAKFEIRPSYRPDIDGLRAVAILSVLIYHVSESALPGGFAGVDVFFVISGFLISSLIFKELDNGGFRFGDFYIRRIRRIFPVLILMMIASLIAGKYLLTANEYTQLNKHVLGGGAFAANILQWREAGYFDVDARLKPLLHLWSLGIEEQFYIAWPIAAVMLWRRRFGAVTSILFLLSLGLNILWTPHHPVGAFYLPFGRAWELLLGCLLAFRQHGGAEADHILRNKSLAFTGIRVKDALSILGAVLLAISFVTITPRAAFPGWWALLPTMGAASLIWAGETAWFNTALLSRPAVVFVGLISYPLYLWHWPLLSFLRITSSTEPSILIRVLAAAAAFLLATLTYRLVELPLRTLRLPRIAIAAALSLAMLTLSTVGYFDYRKGAPSLPAAARISNCSDFLDRDAMGYRYCLVRGDPTLKQTFVIWGDSHASSWATAAAAIAKQKNAKLVEIAHPGCPPVLEVRRSVVEPGQECTSFALANAILGEIAKLAPQQIFLVARWSLYTRGLYSRGQLIEPTFLTTDAKGDATPQTSEAALRVKLAETVRRLAQIAPVIVVKTMPTLHMPFDSGVVRDPKGFEPTLKEYRAYEAIPDAAIDSAVAQTPGATVFDPATLLCADKCRARWNGIRVYEDDSHLTDKGALLFVPELSRLIGRADQSKRPGTKR